MKSMQISDPTEVGRFFRRNNGIQAVYEDATAIAAEIFSDTRTYSLAPAGIAAFGLIAMAHETFLEVLCLAENGFGRGAQGRLRTMFEQVAVAAYITKNESEAEKFVKFQVVETRKELLRAKEVLSKTGNAEFIAQIDARVNALDADLDMIKAEYGKRFGSSWHEGVSNIAEDLGWEHHFFYSYLIPNRHVHASPLMLERRTAEEGHLYFSGEPDRDCADEAVRGALTMLVLAYAVAQDIGIVIGDGGALDRLSKRLVAFYQGKPNLTRL